MTAAIRGPQHAGASAPSGAAALACNPAGAFSLDQLMLAHLSPDRRQVEDLVALHSGHRPPRQAGAAAPAAGRLVPNLPVRPGHLH